VPVLPWTEGWGFPCRTPHFSLEPEPKRFLLLKILSEFGSFGLKNSVNLRIPGRPH
jgi:hypothetical protein